MSAYLLAVYVHILVAVFWTGYVLFWTIIIGPLARNFDAPESARLLHLLNWTRWPPGSVPTPYRVKFPGLGWAALLVLVGTGVLILYCRGVTPQAVVSGELFFSAFGRTLAVKLALVVGLAIGQLLLAYRPAPRLIYLNLLVTLSVVSLSALLAH